jgi:hypothetical protein
MALYFILMLTVQASAPRPPILGVIDDCSPILGDGGLNRSLVLCLSKDVVTIDVSSVDVHGPSPIAITEGEYNG